MQINNNDSKKEVFFACITSKCNFEFAYLELHIIYIIQCVPKIVRGKVNANDSCECQSIRVILVLQHIRGFSKVLISYK